MDEILLERAKIILDNLKDYHPEEPLTGVEIGVYRGDMIMALLELCPRISKIIGIDPYNIDCGYRKRWTQRNWDKIFWRARKNLRPYEGRFVLIRDKSELCSEEIPMVDFIEIDGLHTYEQVTKDITLYEPKVKSGGIICGHDYFGKFWRRVRRAVDGYALEHKRELLTGSFKSGMWYWRVP